MLGRVPRYRAVDMKTAGPARMSAVAQLPLSFLVMMTFYYNER